MAHLAPRLLAKTLAGCLEGQALLLGKLLKERVEVVAIGLLEHGDGIGRLDQAGLMVRVDAEHWIKTGIEYVHGVQYVSAVVTNDFSDWAVAPLPQNPPAIWLRLVRKAEAVEIFYSLDGAAYTLLRIAYLLPSAEAMAGVMCAAPDGSGFPVEFTGFNVRSLDAQGAA